MGFYKPEDTTYAINIVRNSKIVYASMEIGLDPKVHTYSGGLGILAGDTLNSCADLGLSVTGITLLYRNGYFKQEICNDVQCEKEEPWDVEEYTTAIPEARVHISIEGRTVLIEPRIGIIVGHEKDIVSVLFLDSGLEENDPRDQAITDRLYGGDERMRVKQEAVLGICGKRVLRKLEARKIHTFHMNEGHAAFAPVEDARYLGKYYGFNAPKIQELVRSKHVFTTHTPVPAGHDRFSYDLLREVLGEDDVAWDHLDLGGHSECNMTKLALNLSRFANGVAQKHGEISRKMFPGYPIDAITNGIHLPTWMSPHIQELLDELLPSWRHEPGILRHAYRVILPDAIQEAHGKAKQDFFSYGAEHTGVELNPKLLTVGFARRFAPYKRADLIFKDMDRLVSIAQGKIQFVFAGEAHPRDQAGKDIMRRVLQYAKELAGRVTVVFIQDYNMEVSKHMISGCDLWLNNPVPPKEASGTSVMKASANGLPNLSTLDGWWIEGITHDPLSGWIIQHRHDGKDEISLYEQLEHISNVFHDHKTRWAEHMVHALSLAYFFNTHRMVEEYEQKAWSLKLY
jgi:starch phosphorylase